MNDQFKKNKVERLKKFTDNDKSFSMKSKIGGKLFGLDINPCVPSNDDLSIRPENLSC